VSVIVIGEADGAAIKPASQQAAALAAQLGDTVGLVFGSSGAASQLAAPRVVSASALESYDALQFTAVAARVARDAGATAVVMGATAMGKDLGPRLAAELGWGYIADALEYDSGAWTRPNYAGKVLARLEPDGPFVATLRPNAFPASDGGAGAVEEFGGEAPGTPATTVALESAGSNVVELTEAAIVVSGGRGLEEAENYDKLIRPLSAALDAACGASRAIVDAGWVPHSHQVGQTGKTVTPELYLAVGISGAIQHLGGMSGSKCIVAINKDAEAPIFKVADYGIVHDLFEIIPALMAALDN
jgi:electron transfer flavoprotein alpha subunit|tara:strand:- start:2195 stop:3100 length:906 start_codon:yes stop_codon:yes gene_type:complete